MAGIDKLPAIEDKSASDDLQRTTSITSDAKGNTIITREDGEVFTISEKDEKALVWKFDLRILPLLAMMYLVRSHHVPLKRNMSDNPASSTHSTSPI